MSEDDTRADGPASRSLLLQLQTVLADLYRTNERALELAEQAGLDIASIPQSSRPKSTWWNILIEADRQLMLSAVVELARKEYPQREDLRLAGPLADTS